MPYSKMLVKYTLSEHFIRNLLDLLFRCIKSSAAIAYPLRGLLHCVFRDAVLHTTVVMHGYLIYCHLPVSPRRTAAHWMFFVFRTILCKL